jgi:Tol biopolymer transport system component
MMLTAGTRLGPYVIDTPLGAGGMGEVYRAHDSVLNRDVAIKVLPELFAADSDRLARFEREAQTLAVLNHPNIAQVFGFEKGTGHFRALAMEFVEGPTLAERIESGPLPLDEAIPIAAQVADALENAHDHGIVHRDLKPQNIKVRPDGTVKVLDFGLAKAIAPSESSSGAAVNTPTITTPAMTRAGVVLGTAAYMSPEQAKGLTVDRRADIWAFGCVLFEMLTGTRAFAGSDVSDVFVAIMRDEPRWSALPATTPPHVRSLLHRCLQKDPRKRLPHIGVARLELAEPWTAPIPTAPDGGGPRMVWRVATAAAIVAALAVPSWMLWARRAAPASPLRVRVELGTPDPVMLAASPALALSPDGKALAFVGRPPDDVLRSAIYLRSLDRLDAPQILGTEGGQFPFFSPDGRWLAFFAQNTLKKLAVSGGAVVSICAVTAPRGGSWGEDDVIVFASAAGLSRVRASGGQPEVFAKTAPGEAPPSSPQVLPRRRGVLYMPAVSSDPAVGTVLVQGLDGGAPKEIMRGGRSHRYAASGHLTFVRNGTLFAAPFDLDRLEVRGEPVSAVEGVFQAPMTTLASVAISENGTLAYLPGAVGALRQAPIMWMTQAGGLTPLRAMSASFGFQRFSPDGKRLAMTISDGRESDIWVYDLERDILTRITTDAGVELAPVWTPDGTGLVFGAGRGSPVFNLYWQRADGTGEATRLTTSSVSQLPDSIDPEGRLLVYHEGDPLTARQALMVLPLERDGNKSVKGGTPSTLIGGPFLKSNARISPDGKWVAYAANDTGVFEIYVQRFPDLGERVQVSNGGGNLAVWSARTNELYYVKPGVVRLTAVSYTVRDGVFASAKPRLWSQTLFSAEPAIAAYGPAFDIHPDGERFAVTPPLQPIVDGATRGAQVVLLFNFFEELRRVAPLR